MVRLTSPLNSAAAHGSLAGALVFSNARGIHQARKHTIPKNPKTLPQRSVRAATSFLATNWKTLTEPQKASWQNSAQINGLTRFNAYNSYNLTRWRNAQGMSKSFPATEADQWSVIVHYPPSPLGDGLTLPFVCLQDQDTWFVSIHRSSTTGVTPQHNNCVDILLMTGELLYYATDSPLESGTYYYISQRHTALGRTEPGTQFTGIMP